MAVWSGYLHRRVRSAIDKAYTVFWYKFMVYRLGSKCLIASPFYTYRPDRIEIGDGVFFGPGCRLETYLDDQRV